MDTKRRPSGIDGLGEMSWGNHFCLFYETREDLLDFFIPFFKAGLEHEEFCLCIASEPLIAEKVERAMRQAFPDFERYLATGQIEITSQTDWFLKEGHFDEQHVLQNWIDKLNQALEKGFSGMRFAANIMIEKPDWESFARYEGKLEETLHDLRIEGLCAYNLNRYSATNMLDIMQHHQFTLARRDGIWEPLEGAQLKRAHEEVLKLNTELEQRVMERTAQFNATNEYLKTEIAERERAEALLQAREQEFRTIVENAPDQIIRYDRNLHRVYVNPAVTKVYDLTKEMFVEKPAGSIVADAQLVADTDEVEAVKQKIRGVFDTGQPTEYEVTWPVPSGRRTFWARLFPEFDRSGAVVNVLGIARDITERKRAEEALRASEARLQAAIDAADIGLWEWDLVSGQIIWLGHHDKLFGFAPSEFDGTYSSFEKRIHPDDLEELNSAVQQAREEHSEYIHEYRVVWPDSSIHWIVGRGRFVYNETRQPVRMHGAVLDITARKQVDEALRRSENNFRTLADKSVQGIVIYQDQKIVYVNQAHATIMGYSIEELKSMSLQQLIALTHPDDRAMAAERTRKRLAGEQLTPSVDLRVVRKDSATRWIQAFNSDIEYFGRPALLSTTLDITERKRAEEALRTSERVLREAEVLGHTGSWEQDLVTGEIFNTEENLRVFFGDDRSKGADFEDYAEVVHPDDREYVLQRRAELIEEQGPGDIEYRVVWPDGSIHWIFGRATVVRDELGQPIRVYGTNVDITERKRAETTIRSLLQISEKLTATLDVDALLDSVAIEALNLIDAEIGWSGLRTEEGMVCHTHIGRDLQVIPFKYTWPPGIGLPGWVLVHKVPYVMNDAQSDKFLIPEIRERFGVKNAIDTPILDTQGEVIGFFEVNNKKNEAGFTESDVEKLVAVSRIASIALQNAMSYANLERTEEELRKQAARAETLSRIAARLNRQLDLDAVIHAICQEAVDTFKVSQATMSLYNKKRDLLEYAGGFNIPPKYAAKIEPISRAQFEEFVRTMGPVLVVPDIQALPNVPNTEFSTELDVRTVVTADVRRDHELIGVLALGVNSHVREFDKDPLSLLKAISDQAAIAVANALLLKEANEQREQLRALSTRLVQVQETERRALTTELHDRVGQNLTGLSINLQNMKVLLSKESAKTLAPKFDDAQALVEDTTRQIRDIMAELYLPELEDYGLAAALETYAERAASRGNLELIADLPDLAPLPPPSEVRVALFRAAQEAISNVLKHAYATQLEIQLQGENGRVRLRVEDNGQGFEPEAASQKEAPSWGLKIMRERIESIGGHVQIESEPGKGTRVTFEIERPN